MAEPLGQFLEALKQVVSSPAVGEISNATLRTQLQMVDRVLAHMLVRETMARQIESAALREFLDAAAGAEDLLRQRGLPTQVLQSLQELTRAAPPARLEEILEPVRDLQQQLCSIVGDDARARRREVVAIESRCSRKFSAELEGRLAAPRGGQQTGAVNTRSIDEAKFNEFLASAFPDEPEVRVAGYSYIAGGHSKFTARVRLSGTGKLPESVILRGDGSAKFGGVSVRDEYRLLQVLHRHGVSAPRPLALDAVGSSFGAPIILVEEVPGRIIGHMFALPPPSGAICRDAAEKLARLHRIPASEFADLTQNAGRTSREMATQWLDESYAAFKALNRPSPTYETAFDWLRKNVALNDGPPGLVHGDYGLNNLLIDQDRVSAILDWEFAHLGNSVYDLGYFYFQADHLASWSEFMHAYRSAGGLEPPDAKLNYAILFAATRLGVMVCQTEAGFASGAIQGIGGAVAHTGFHDVSIERIARILDRVL